MVMRPVNYFLRCTKCGWETLQRTLGCQPSFEELLRAEKDAPKDGICPKCGNDKLIVHPADTIKGRIMALLKGY